MATKKVGAKTTASKRTTKPRIKVVDQGDCAMMGNLR